MTIWRSKIIFRSKASHRTILEKLSPGFCILYRISVRRTSASEDASASDASVSDASASGGSASGASASGPPVLDASVPSVSSETQWQVVRRK